MSNLVPIALALILVLLALPLLIRVLKLLFVRVVVRRVLKDVGDKAIAKQPDEIHLVAAPSYQWSNPEASDKLAQPLKTRGFIEAGIYTITEMPGVGVRFLLNQATNSYACVYEHGKAGNWVEVISRYQSGLGATYSQQPDRGMVRRSEDLVVNAPGADPGELYERMLAERPKEPLISLSEGNIPRLFEKVFADQIRWKKERGAKPEEVARVVKSLKEHPIGKGADGE